MKAPRLLAENVAGLLRDRGYKQTDLAQWCRRSDVWVSQFLRGERNWQLDDLDRVADFFGIATYQLFQPGLSRTTERRSGVDRRQGRERRISNVTRNLQALAVSVGQPIDGELSPAEKQMIAALRAKPGLAAAVRQVVGVAPVEDSVKPARKVKSNG